MSNENKPEGIVSFFGRLLEGFRNQKKEDLQRQFPDPEKLKDKEKDR